MLILKGAEVSQKIQTEIEKEISKWKERGIKLPHLSVVLVGDDPASHIYVQRKQQMCKKLGFTSEVIQLPATIKQADVKQTIEKLNKYSDVDGILVQLPLPSQGGSAGNRPTLARHAAYRQPPAAAGAGLCRSQSGR